MSNLLAVIIGCNYENDPRVEVSPLKAAEPDARRIAGWMLGAAVPNGVLTWLTLLLGGQATTNAIGGTLNHVRRLQGHEDTLLVYFSGHGRQREDGLWLVTADGEVRASDLLDVFGPDPGPTRIVLDCCHAGAIQASVAAE
jgi:hypothetical protein